MRQLRFWKEAVEVFEDENADVGEEQIRWFCSDGISTFFGETRSEAASHFGVPVGFED
ncbi:MAG: hypothetical protein RAO92_02030 [Candidatus Euphemobacter frigidus]|nr:hypothetical protein [Candidatus Euphemobacter frigidus]